MVMKKAAKTTESHSKEDAFEIIELASQDLETLAKAFDLISEVCTELEEATPSIDNKIPEQLIN